MQSPNEIKLPMCERNITIKGVDVSLGKPTTK